MKTISTFSQYAITNQEINECTGGTVYMDLAIPSSFPQNIQDRLTVIRDRYMSLINQSIQLEESGSTAQTSTSLQRINTRINMLFSNYVRVVTQYEASL